MILLEPSKEQLKYAVDLNRAEFLLNFTADERVKSFQTLNSIGIYSEINDPLVNRIAWFNFNNENLQEFENLLQKYINRGVPFLIHTGPSTKPQNISIITEKFGIRKKSEETAMYLDFSDINFKLNECNNFKIEIVDSKLKSIAFSEIFAKAFGATKDQAEIFYQVDSKIGYGKDTPRVNYIGFYKGEPAAISSVNYGYGVAGIYAVCTLPEFRGKGFGKLMTSRPLSEAKGRNYKYSILHASEMGTPLYKKLGYNEIGSCGRFFWEAPL